MILAEKIILLRKSNGWSQEELAEQLDISRQSVSKWELGASIPDLDKVLKMSKVFDVSTDYLLKDEIEEFPNIEISVGDSVDTYEGMEVHSVSMEEANEFMELTRKTSSKIAAAVAVLILSPVVLLFLGGLSELTNSPLTEDMAGGIGMIVLLLMVVAALVVLIPTGMQLARFEYLEKEIISLQYGVQGVVEKKKKEFEPIYRKSVVLGVVLCIIGVIPMMGAIALTAPDRGFVGCVDLLLICVACGVYTFIRYGSIQESYNKLLQKGDYTREKKELGRKTGIFAKIYWCTVTAIYLGVSLTKNNWGDSWIIWPVAGVLFAALQGVIQLITRDRR